MVNHATQQFVAIQEMMIVLHNALISLSSLFFATQSVSFVSFVFIKSLVMKCVYFVASVGTIYFFRANLWKFSYHRPGILVFEAIKQS